MEPKYPHIKIQLSGEDGNAFLVISRVRKALKKYGASQEDIKAFVQKATSGDYNNVLVTCMKYVTVE